MRNWNLIQFLLAFVFVFFLTTCTSDDPCKDVDCGQTAILPTGKCVEGVCECNHGFEGAYCAEEWSFKFIGKYLGEDVFNTKILRFPVPPAPPSSIRDTLDRMGTFEINEASPITIDPSTDTTVVVRGLGAKYLNSAFIVPITRSTSSRTDKLKCTNLLGIGVSFEAKLTLDATLSVNNKNLKGAYTLFINDTITTKGVFDISK
jgi:hypothetical protein